jgi:hypothetical protein
MLRRFVTLLCSGTTSDLQMFYGSLWKCASVTPLLGCGNAAAVAILEDAPELSWSVCGEEVVASEKYSSSEEQTNFHPGLQANNIPTYVSTHTYVAEGGIAVHRILRIILGVIFIQRPHSQLSRWMQCYFRRKPCFVKDWDWLEDVTFIDTYIGLSNWFFMTPSIATKFQYINSLLFSFFTHYMFLPLRAILRWDIQLDI